jgi:hypothetical protein
MREEEAIAIATSFVETQWGRRAQLIGAKAPSKRHSEWTVLYKTSLPGGAEDEVVDGPTVVLVDPGTSTARFLTSP